MERLENSQFSPFLHNDCECPICYSKFETVTVRKPIPKIYKKILKKYAGYCFDNFDIFINEDEYSIDNLYLKCEECLSCFKIIKLIFEPPRFDIDQDSFREEIFDIWKVTPSKPYCIGRKYGLEFMWVYSITLKTYHKYERQEGFPNSPKISLPDEWFDPDTYMS